jgi:hypothetical protein
MSNVLAGGCLCGAIRYEVRGAPSQQTVCHCSICRRSTGAPMVGWFSVGLEGFAITRGQPARYRSSARALRSHCPACGTQLTFQYDGLAQIDVSICSLDDPAAVTPMDHTFVSTQLPWVQLGDRLPRFEQARSPD